MRKKVTIRDVAKACGVSVYTVSSVLNNKGDISEKTTRKVLKTIRELNYDPLKNIPLARGLRTQTLGLVLPNIYSQAHPFYFRAVQTAQAAASDLHYDIKLLTENDLYLRLSNSIDLGCDRVMLFCPNGSWKSALKQLTERNIPVALIRRETKQRGVIVAVDNDERGMQIVMEHLHKAHGLNQIALVGGSDYIHSSNSRLDGYRTYIQQHGLSENPMLLMDTDAAESLEDRIEKLYRTQKLDAVIGLTDDFVVDIAKIILQMGLRIPEDIAVAGFNNDASVRQFHPGITSVNIPVEEMVAAACQSLFNYTPAMAKAMTRMEFDTSLVIRESCGKHE